MAFSLRLVFVLALFAITFAENAKVARKPKTASKAMSMHFLKPRMTAAHNGVSFISKCVTGEFCPNNYYCCQGSDGPTWYCCPDGDECKDPAGYPCESEFATSISGGVSTLSTRNGGVSTPSTRNGGVSTPSTRNGGVSTPSTRSPFKINVP